MHDSSGKKLKLLVDLSKYNPHAAFTQECVGTSRHIVSSWAFYIHQNDLHHLNPISD